MDLAKLELINPIKLELATKDNSVCVAFETEPLKMNIGDHAEEIQFIIVPALKEEVILGKKWLDKHIPDIDWPAGQI